MKGPASLIDHLAARGYHPRTNAHSNAICAGLLDDILDHCPAIRSKAGHGELVARINHTVIRGHERWNLDMAIGPPASVVPPEAGQAIRFDTPVLIEIAVEAKGVMTEHGKARHNRLRDLQAFHNHAHGYDKRIIAAAVVVVNVADVFWSPTRDHGDITLHRNIQRLGRETVELFRSLPLRNSTDEGPGLEALGIIVVDHDNIAQNPAPPAGAPQPQLPRLLSRAPAPAPGDPLHFSALVHRICSAYRDRWTQ